MSRTETARNTLTQHTVAELRQLASEANVAGRSKMRKAELVEALLPTQLAEMGLGEANRRASLVPADGSLVRAAINAKDAYLEVVAKRGQENGGPEVSAAWEDYLDACVAAETCALTTCWDRATDDGRCGKHSWGAPLGQDVVSRETEAEEFASVPAEVVAEPDQAFAEELQASPTPRSGYTDCECRDCFDITIGGSVCHHCEEAGCSDDGDQECYRDDAYQG